METIIGIELFPLISLVIFFVFFTVMLYMVFKLKKSHINKMSHLPLNEEETKNLESV